MGWLTGVLMLLSGCATTACTFTNEALRRRHHPGRAEGPRGGGATPTKPSGAPTCMAELPVRAELVADAGPDVLAILRVLRSRPMPGSKFHVWLANTPTFFRDRVLLG